MLNGRCNILGTDQRYQPINAKINEGPNAVLVVHCWQLINRFVGTNPTSKSLQPPVRFSCVANAFATPTALRRNASGEPAPKR